MKINLKFGVFFILLSVLFIVCINSLNTINSSKIDTNNIVNTYHTNLIESIHTINLKQFNNQDLLETLYKIEDSNKEAIKTLKKAKNVYSKDSQELNSITSLIRQYSDLNTAIKKGLKFLVNNKVAYYHDFSSIITEIVNELDDETLCFETAVLNSIVENLGISNILEVSIKNLYLYSSLARNYSIVVQSIFKNRWSSSTSLSCLEFDIFNSIKTIENKYPGIINNYEFSFTDSNLDTNGDIASEDYIKLNFSYDPSEDTVFSEELFKNNYNLWVSPSFS